MGITSIGSLKYTQRVGFRIINPWNYSEILNIYS